MRKGRDSNASPRFDMPPLKPLRVAVVTDGIYPYFKGGKEVRFHQLLRRLAGPDVEIDIFTMHWWDGPGIARKWPLTARHLPQLVYVCRRASFFDSSADVRACAVHNLSPSRPTSSTDHIPPTSGLRGLKVISRLRGIPLIVTWHEWWGQTYWRSYLGRLGQMAARLERFVVSLADCLIVPTEQTAASMTAAGVDRDTIAVLPSGIDMDAIALVGPAQRCYDIVFVGRLLHHKGADMLLGALKELRERSGRRVSCAIVGEGPEKPQLDLLVHQLGLCIDVEFLGATRVSRVGVRPHQERHGVRIANNARGIGIAVAEALACGTQVVTTAHDDNQARHLIEDGVTGYLCDPTVGSLADTLEKALSCPLPTEQVRGRAMPGVAVVG